MTMTQAQLGAQTAQPAADTSRLAVSTATGASGALKIDGRLDDDAWAQARPTTDLADFATFGAMLVGACGTYEASSEGNEL